MKSIIEKNPFIFSIGFVVITMLVPWGLLYPLASYIDSYLYSGLKYFVSLIIAVLITLGIWRKIPGSLGVDKFLKNLFTFGLLGLICVIPPLIFSYDTVDISPTPLIVIEFIFYIINVVVAEEFIFRVVILPLFIKKYGTTKKGLIKGVLLSQIVFGLRHLINLILFPGSLITTLGQVLFTFMAGVYLAAIYIRTKNIWINVVIHFLEDFASLFWCLFSTNAIESQNQDGEPIMILGMVVLQSVYLIVGILMLRDKKWVYPDLEENIL